MVRTRIDVLLLGMTRQNPGRLDNWDTQLQRLLILHAGCTGHTSHSLCTPRGGSRSSTNEMCGVDLNLITPLRTHLAQRHLRILKQDRILNITETDGDTRRICHSMSSNAEEVGSESSGGRSEDELECVFGVELEA